MSWFMSADGGVFFSHGSYTDPTPTHSFLLLEGVWGGVPEDRIPPKICPEDGIPNFWVEDMGDRIRIFWRTSLRVWRTEYGPK